MIKETLPLCLGDDESKVRAAVVSTCMPFLVMTALQSVSSRPTLFPPLPSGTGPITGLLCLTK